MRNAVRAAAVCVVMTLAAAMPCLAQGTTAAPKPATPVVVLDTASVWRTFEVLKPPVIELDDPSTSLGAVSESNRGIKPVTSNYVWLDKETPAPAADWTKAEFADATWLRGAARTFSRTAYVANLYARAKFEITDPALVKDLKISVAYYGGAIVYVNGQEIARGNLAQDVKESTALAESYPAEAYLSDKGVMMGPDNQNKAVMAARERKLTDITVPAKDLRKGVNVLAIEMIRAPYHKLLAEKKNQTRNDEVKDQNCPYDFKWFTCDLRQVSLMAGGASGLVPNAARPKELQAWTSDILTADLRSDFGDRCDGIRPVVIKGPRNGWSSGKVVVGSPKAIEGLKATPGDLKQGDAVIPASAVRIRYATAFGTWGGAPLDSLLESPLESFPAENGAAVVPIWLTVKVPLGAKPGTYAGQVTIEAKGEKAITVPVSLDVADFAAPDTQDYRTWIELMQSPDTLAAEYNLPLWSDKHWAMIADSMRYIGEIGSRVVQIPLIAQTNSGNAESMVRFIKKADGSNGFAASDTYDYDFTVMDKYLDLAEKNMGKPKFVAFIAWDIYLDTPKKEVTAAGKDSNITPNHTYEMEGAWQAARWDLRGKGPAVTALDPATGKIETINLPRFEDPNSKAIWKPLFDALHKRMAARGLEKTMLLGMASDKWANKEEMTLLEDVSGNLPWINHTHGGNHVGTKLDGLATVAYTAFVWNVTYAKDPGKQSYGWKQPNLWTEFRRGGALSDWPLSTILLFPELQITGGQRGIGRIGGDFWPVYKDKQGRRRDWVWDRYPQSLWHSCNLSSHMLVPGPTGPVATSRYEVMREGVQECEARIAIEAALTDEALKAKVGADLAGRCRQLLDDRIWQELKAFSDLQLTGRTYATAGNNWYYGCGGTPGHYWYAGSGWQDRTQRLYDLAAEVTKKIAEK